VQQADKQGIVGTRVVRAGAAGAFAALLTLASASGCSGEGEDPPSSSGKGGASGASGGAGGASGGAGGASGNAGSAGKSGSNAGGSSGSSGSGTGGDSSGSGGTGGDSSGSGGSAGDAGSAGSSGTSAGEGKAAELARKLGREPNFFIGMGNDLSNDHDQDGAYTLGVTLDLHYAYLVGLPGEGGWPDWNAGGTFVNILTDTADAHGVTPMFDLYAMAARGEANTSTLQDPGYMTPYWAATKLLFERLAVFDKPAVVHLEPDFWAFVQQLSGGDPSSIDVLIHEYAPECSDLPEDLVGMGKCILKLARMYAPKTAVGFHASRWAGDPSATVDFLTALGAADADFIGIDMLDRDAGCFEAHVDPNCQRSDGPWYWDETNQTSPNFHEYLAYSKQMSDGLGVPVIWWQIPFGVPSDEPGGTAEHYRDNRVRYIFSHIDEFVDAGGLGAAFGVGAGNQTYITTDGGQFQNAVTAYYADPVPLP
jgi:hypothetical protein